MKGKAVARLTKEIKAVQDELPPGVVDMHLNENNMHELYFLLAGPEDTPYAGGMYILKMVLPKNYPFSAPDFFVVTPNGRFATNTKICTTFSSFHPETWTPSYTLTTLLISFLSFFVDTGMAAGAIHTSDAEKRRCAADSVRWNKTHAQGVRFKDALPILRHLPEGGVSAQALKDALCQRFPAKHAQVASSTAAQSAAPASTTAAKQPLAENAAAKQPAGQLAVPKAAPAAKAHKHAMDLTSTAPTSAANGASGGVASVSGQMSPPKRGNKRAASSDVVVLDDAVPTKRAAIQPARPVVPAGGDAIDLT